MIIPPIKIGIVGQPAGGKDTLAAYLKNHYGFTHLSTSDFIRFYILENNLGKPTRPFMQEMGNMLRAKYGGDYLMKLALKTKSDYLVISGIRNPDEAKTLKMAEGKLLALSAPIEQRYNRAVARNRTGDHITFEEFKKEQAFEDSNVDSNAQNVLAVIALADYSIENNGTPEELYQKIDNLLLELSKK